MRLFPKIAAVAVSATMAMFAMGCSSSETTSQDSTPGFEPQAIEINESGFAVTDDGMLSYAFVAVNPNEGHVAQDVVFTIEAYDDNGSMIAGGGDSIPVLYPGVETAAAGETELFSKDTSTPKVARLSISALLDSATWTDTSLTADDVENLVDIVNPRMSENDNELNIKASIVMNTGDDDTDGVSGNLELRAVALLSNAAGQAICGTEPVVFTLSSDSPDYDLTTLIVDAPDYEECNLYVTPNALV